MVHSIGLTLDPGSPEPLYRQIFDQIVDRIRTGTFPAGFRLPPTRTLAEELDAHRNTIVRAYADLEAAGFVTSTVGRGTFVAPPPRSQQLASNSQPDVAGIPWASLVSRAAEAEPLGRIDRLRVGSTADTINLYRMQPSADLLPDELLRRCIEHVLRTQGAKVLGYNAREGLPRLRALIAEDLARQGVPARAENILITTGSQQGLDLIARALVNPGDAFLVDQSTYSGAINLLTAAGARLVGVPGDEQGPDMNALERLARPNTKGFYLMPGCGNPSGTCISAERRDQLVNWSRRLGIPLIEDDYAADLWLDDGQPPPALRALDGDVIYTGTFSKKLMPALRIGYVLCPTALLPRLLPLKHAMDLGTSQLLQYALAEFMERGYLRAHLARTVPEYRRRRDAMETALARHLPATMRWVSPRAGLVLWIPLPEWISADAVFEEAQRHGVLVSPGTLNSVDTRPLSGIRLTFGCEPPERLIEGARRLGKALHVLMARLRGGAGIGMNALQADA
jgi:2-aminoadipate transaminase